MNPYPHDFSQHSLQDYLDCPLRFKLRHLDKFAWPAAQTDDQLENEMHQRKGVEFHRLVQQWAVGIEEAVLENGITDPHVHQWWDWFKTARGLFPNGLEARPGDLRQVEYTLIGQVAGLRLLAKLDLWIVRPGEQIWIFDWKTNRRPIPENVLTNRIQTRVYRYLAVSTGGRFAKAEIFPPEQVEMIYWQTALPGHLTRLQYSLEQYQRDGENLSHLMQEISSLREDQFEKTPDSRKCKFCNYRSYCERGLLPGSLDEMEQAGVELDDLSDVEAIEY
jgi:hypothetical protein